MAFRIINPIPGTSEFTTDKRARRYIQAGMAELVGRASIRFVHTAHQCQSAQRSFFLSRDEIEYDKAAHAGQINQRQAKGLPFAGDLSRMGLVA